MTEVTLDEDGERWLVEAEADGGKSRHAGGALVLTGPGIHRAFPHEPAVADRVFHCDSRRDEFARIPEDSQCDVAIVGGGESALSATMFLRGMRPDCRFTIYTPMLPMSRGESFLENRVFSNPDTVEWESLDQQTRRDFVKHSDRGVFDPPSLAAIAYDERCRFVTGRVTDVGAAAAGEGVRLEFESPEGGRQQRARLRRQLHRLRPAGAAAHALPGGGARGDRAPQRADLGPAGRQRGADRPQPGAEGDAARGCRSPAWPVSARAPASPTSAPSGCSPTACCSRYMVANTELLDSL